MQDIFLIVNYYIINYVNSKLFTYIKSQVKIINLKGRFGVTIITISNIQNHLYFDRKRNILKAFYYIAFFKE